MTTLVTVEMAIRLTQDQARNLPTVGAIDLFGDTVTEQDAIRALESLARETTRRIALIGTEIDA